MTVYRIPLPARSSPATAAPGHASPERWLLGLVASHARWPADRYEFHLPQTGLPLFLDHQERLIDGSGMVDGDVGAARFFCEVADLGLIALIEVSADHPYLLWDVAEGRRAGLSIGYALDTVPGGDGPEWLYVREVSLTSRPRDPLARVISSGQLALDDWAALSGEPVPAAAQAACPDGP